MNFLKLFWESLDSWPLGVKVSVMSQIGILQMDRMYNHPNFVIQKWMHVLREDIVH